MTTAIHDLITLRSLEFRQTTPQGSRSSESLSCGWSTGPVQARTGCDGDEAYYLVHDDSLQFAVLESRTADAIEKLLAERKGVPRDPAAYVALADRQHRRDARDRPSMVRWV